MRKLLFLVAVMAITAFGIPPRESQAATIIADSGWVSGEASSDTDLLSFDFTLAMDGIFSLTDCCNIGDIWTLAGDIAGASTFGLAAIAVPLGIGEFPDFFDPAWQSAAFSHFQIALAAGTYSFTVSGDGAGGFPAGVGVRVDVAPVPLPASGLLLLGALGVLGALRRRKFGMLA